MPTLDWIGKQAVVKHHKDVPYRLLEPVKKLSYGVPNSGNLIVQGDNLHALKALLPRYAGKVKCIYIDPPYNTGNESWVYNDNVNSPEIKKWLNNVVGKEGEDLSRQDKWLCMMYPRLVLLKNFLHDDGVIFVSIDDNAHALLRMLMDEIFSNCYKNTISVRRGIKNVQAQFEDLSALSVGHEYILMYSRNKSTRLPKLMLEHEIEQPGKWDTFWRGTDRKTMRYELFGNKPETGQWRWEINRAKQAVTNYHYYLENVSDDMSLDEWFIENLTSANIKLDFVRQNDGGSIQYYVPPRNGKLLSDNWMDILLSGSETKFDTEKNIKVIQRIIKWVTEEGDVILDSFAGSGTTGHAVLSQQSIDNKNRHFLLVEMEEEVVKNILLPRIKNAVTGYKKGKQQIKGLGSGFQYCTLSEEPLFDSNGEIRTDVKFPQLAEFVWFTETGSGFTGKGDSPLLGIHEGRAIYLLYNGILKDKSVDGGNVLTTPVLNVLPKYDGKQAIYAAACRLGAARLNKLGITFKQTPYALDV